MTHFGFVGLWQISEQYKAKRKDVDELKEDLQKKIMDYTKYAESGDYFE